MKTLENKIKEEIIYFDLMGIKIKNISFSEECFPNMKEIFSNRFQINKKNLGYFKCAITWLDGTIEKTTLIS